MKRMHSLILNAAGGGTVERLHSLIVDIAGVSGRSWVVVVQW